MTDQDQPPAEPAEPAAPAPPVRAAAAPGARHVYAIGRIEARFPSLGVEKEFAQAAGRAQTAGLTDRETVHAVLQDPANRYLARKLCWVLTIEGQDTYLLLARDRADADMLTGAIRPDPRAGDVDVVIGSIAGLATPDMCNGLIVPVVAFDQIYSFDTDGFLAAIPRPDGIAARSALYRSTIMYRRTAASPAVTGLRPAQDPCDVTCGPSDDYVANPYDCGSFYQCSNGVPYLQQCPSGLVFNPNVQPGPVCDWPANYQCTPTCTS